MEPTRIIFAGTPDFAVPSLQALIDGPHQVCAVYTQPDRPAGRGRKLQASPIKQLAEEHDIPVCQPKSLKKKLARAELAEWQPDMMIVAAYGLILPQSVLDIPRLGCVNVHGSILPRWRGAAPIQRALMAGDTETGITIMQMEAGLDTGPMLHKLTCPIEPDDIGQTLHDKLAELGAQALTEALENWDKIIPETQDDALATYAHKLDKAEAELDWNKSAHELALMIRAFNPWPVTHAELDGLKLRIWEAKVIERNTDAAPGTVLKYHADGIEVATQKDILAILKVQKPGGKAITARDFVNAM
ncbi:MAG: methionyl-tRNA formyltransferase [Pseudomonadota bacterium]